MPGGPDTDGLPVQSSRRRADRVLEQLSSLDSDVKGERVRRVLLAAMVVVSLAGLLAVPARAADTTTTFTLAGGALSISAPGSADLGSASTGASQLSAQLGTVTVTDARGALGATWTATVASTDFTTGAASSNETVGKASVSYWSGAATGSTGTAARVPGQPLAANAVTLAASRSAFSASATVGNNTTSWNPTVIVTLPSSAIAGVYTATITHSVA